MLPNKWIIIWNGLPIGIDQHGGAYKTLIPSKIAYFDDKQSALIFLDNTKASEWVWFVKEIRFRILDVKT